MWPDTDLVYLRAKTALAGSNIRGRKRTPCWKVEIEKKSTAQGFTLSKALSTSSRAFF